MVLRTAGRVRRTVRAALSWRKWWPLGAWTVRCSRAGSLFPGGDPRDQNDRTCHDGQQQQNEDELKRADSVHQGFPVSSLPTGDLVSRTPGGFDQYGNYGAPWPPGPGGFGGTHGPPTSEGRAVGLALRVMVETRPSPDRGPHSDGQPGLARPTPNEPAIKGPISVYRRAAEIKKTVTVDPLSGQIKSQNMGPTAVEALRTAFKEHRLPFAAAPKEPSAPTSTHHHMV